MKIILEESTFMIIFLNESLFLFRSRCRSQILSLPFSSLFLRHIPNFFNLFPFLNISSLSSLSILILVYSRGFRALYSSVSFNLLSASISAVLATTSRFFWICRSLWIVSRTICFVLTFVFYALFFINS